MEHKQPISLADGQRDEACVVSHVFPDLVFREERIQIWVLLTLEDAKLRPKPHVQGVQSELIVEVPKRSHNEPSPVVPREPLQDLKVIENVAGRGNMGRIFSGVATGHRTEAQTQSQGT